MLISQRYRIVERYNGSHDSFGELDEARWNRSHQKDDTGISVVAPKVRVGLHELQGTPQHLLLVGLVDLHPEADGPAGKPPDETGSKPAEPVVGSEPAGPEVGSSAGIGDSSGAGDSAGVSSGVGAASVGVLVVGVVVVTM